MPSQRIPLPVLLVVGFSAVSVVDVTADDSVDFGRDIRPILSAACISCHGPDEDHREADLRLDVREGAVADLGGYKAIEPGNLEASELWNRISTEDPDVRMPPPDSGKDLNSEQIEKLRAWIEQGAAWSQHWAFVAPVRPQVPEVKNADWGRNPIDAFVLAKLEREGLAPSPEADRITLLRRLYLDLVGLPPSIDEIESYRSERADAAYPTLVDQLLKRPQYGERWARHWLDAARYADSDGFEKDKPREVWFYRDYVINALNRDLPYNQFVIEQIAGDLLPDATQQQVVATGFLRNSMINEEGGVDPEQFRMEAMFDRMDAIGKSILGITIQCAQCHNHKYDPVTQEDYYRMFAFLNNCHEARITVYTPDESQERQRILTEIEEIEYKLRADHADWQERLVAWEDELKKADQPKWTAVELEFDAKTIGGQKFLPQGDGSYLAQGYAPTKFRPLMTGVSKLGKITALQLELLTDPNLPHGGPGRSNWGTCALTEFEVQAAPADDPTAKKRVDIVAATADVAQQEKTLEVLYYDKSDRKRITGAIDFAIDGNGDTAWGIDVGPGRRNQARKAVFQLKEPIENTNGTELTFVLAQQHGGWNSDDNQTHNVGRFRISVTDAENPVADPLPVEIREILEIPRSERLPRQLNAVFSYWRTTVEDWQGANTRIDELWAQHPAGSSQLVLQERDEMRPTHRLERGDFLKPIESVRPGVPDFLHSFGGGEEPPRLQFAQWLADRDSPTTARAMVNRIWQAYFGIGLVSTSEDLGSQSELPSHPELLDWLAVEFMESGWSLKHLHRLIVDSATYRQSSHIYAELFEVDPYNRLLARGPRFRVDAEVVRDIALAASGLLNPKVGGPSVYPPAPEFLFQPPASYGPKTWNVATDDSRYRRALYTFRFRSVPYPALQVFDAPNADISCIRRPRSNTPLQALTILNEPLFLECSRSLARKVTTEGGDTDDERLNYAFRRCLTREPGADESRVLLGLLDKQRHQFEKDQDQARELVSLKDAETGSSDSTVTEMAAWTVVARVLLNLDETITKE